MTKKIKLLYLDSTKDHVITPVDTNWDETLTANSEYYTKVREIVYSDFRYDKKRRLLLSIVTEYSGDVERVSELWDLYRKEKEKESNLIRVKRSRDKKRGIRI